MNLKNKALIAFSITVLIGITGCSTASEPISNDNSYHGPVDDSYHGSPVSGLPSWKESDGPKKFSCYDLNSGVTYSFSLPTDTGDPRIQKLESFRSAADAPPVNYLLVEVDATQAVGPASSNSSGYVPWAVNYATADQTSGAAHRLFNATNSPSNWTGWDNGPGGNSDLVEEEANPGARGWGILHANEPITSMVAPSMGSGFHGTVSAECIPDRK